MYSRGGVSTSFPSSRILSGLALSRNRARVRLSYSISTPSAVPAALTTLALAQEESLGDKKPADDLLNLEGLDRAIAFKLAARGVCTLEDLAEQGVDDRADIEGLTDEKAGELIMAARNICWFGDEA